MLPMLSLLVSVVLSIGAALLYAAHLGISCCRKKNTLNVGAAGQKPPQILRERLKILPSAQRAAKLGDTAATKRDNELDKTQDASTSVRKRAPVGGEKNVEKSTKKAKTKGQEQKAKSEKKSSKKEEETVKSSKDIPEGVKQSENEDEECQDVVDHELVKPMGDLDDVVDKKRLEKEIEEMKSVHENEDDRLAAVPPEKDVNIAEDRCMMFRTNTTEFKKERQRRKAELEAKQSAKKPSEDKKGAMKEEKTQEGGAKTEKEGSTEAVKSEDSSVSFRPNF